MDNYLDTFIDKRFDVDFDSVEHLTWYPWIGDNYVKSDRRLLIVGESHYDNTEDSSKREEELEDMRTDKTFTRQIVHEFPVFKDRTSPMFDNLHRTFFLNKAFDSKTFWKNIAFYNFVQRPLIYISEDKQRPNGYDFCLGWKVFLDVVDLIKPTDCIFVGVSAANYLSEAMTQLGCDNCHTKIEWIKGQCAYARKFSILRDWGEFPTICIKHTSMFYSYESWHNFLLNHCEPLLRDIYSLQGLQLGE